MSRIGNWILGRLGRITSSGNFVSEIDGLRFIAIISVMFFHIRHFYMPEAAAACGHGWATMNFLMQQGWFGVQLFFIISGFILSMPFAQQRLGGGQPISLKKYFTRRLTRLEPPYIINMTVALLVVAWMGKMTLSDLLPHYLSGITYTHNFFYSILGAANLTTEQRLNPVNPVTWTLEIEVQFYILAPLLTAVFFIRRAWFRRAVIGLGVLASCCQAQFAWSDTLSQTILGQIRYFLLGFLLADIYLTRWRGKPSKSLAWDLVGLPMWTLIPFMLAGFSVDGSGGASWPLDGGIARNFVLMPVLLLAYVAAFRGRVLNKFFTNPWIVVIGGMCYTIYLYHYPLMVGVGKLLGDPRMNMQPWCTLQMIGCVAGAVVLASILFALFEKPFMRREWPQRLGGWLRIRAARAAAIFAPAAPSSISQETVEAEREEQQV